MISIIIPIYNSELYLRECLISVLQQTYIDFELLLIDDGSTDSSVEICKEFIQKDSRIRFYSQQHQGVSAARNTALDLAKGEYIFFLDSDDMIAPKTLERLHQQMQLKKVELVCCQYICISSEEDWKKKERTGIGEEPEWVIHDNAKMVEQFSQNSKIYGGVYGKLLVQTCIGDLRFEEELLLGEDTLFFYRLIRKGVSAAYTESPMYAYRIHENSLSALRFTLEGVRAVGRVVKEIEYSEQEQGEIENARVWEGEYLRAINCAMNCLDKEELYQMREEVARELKNPYFRQRSLRTKGAVFLAFYCYPFYQMIKTFYGFLKRLKKE